MKIIFATVFFALMFSVFCSATAQPPTETSEAKTPQALLTKTTLPDQFDSSHSIDENTEWVIFSTDSYTSDLIKKALDDLKLTDLEPSKGFYVADISAMPSMITKMLALPEMKKYPFKILLDKEGDITRHWPRQKGKASLLKLKKLEITSQKLSVKFDEIKDFIAEQTQAKK